jgi:DNA-directed RNA polymerase subunit beta'
LIQKVSLEEMVVFLDKLKETGFNYATVSGISISPFELEKIVDKKKKIIESQQQVDQINEYLSQGLYSEREAYQKKITI